jgi:hypothetical protein
MATTISSQSHAVAFPRSKSSDLLTAWRFLLSCWSLSTLVPHRTILRFILLCTLVSTRQQRVPSLLQNSQCAYRTTNGNNNQSHFARRRADPPIDLQRALLRSHHANRHLSSSTPQKITNRDIIFGRRSAKHQSGLCYENRFNSSSGAFLL